MARSVQQEGLFSVSDIGKIFHLDVSKTAILNYEERGIIPQADRVMRGTSAYRAWRTVDLPKIGAALGFLKRPKETQVVSVFSLKGGTGKTTFAFQYARALALHNIRTLVIGLDAQESISQTLNRTTAPVEKELPGLVQCLSDDLHPSRCVVGTDLSTLSYIPETIKLSILDRFLKGRVRKEYVIKERVVDPLVATGAYDVIFFDCNPSWSEAVTGAMACTQVLISPLGCDINSLKAANIFVELLSEFQEDMRHTFQNFFIVPTLVENNKLSQQILAKYRIQYEDLCTTSSIRRTVVVQEASVLGKSLMETAFKSLVYQDFVEVFRELNQAMLDEPETETEAA